MPSEKLDKVGVCLQDMAAEVIKKKMDRLKNRKFVLFPFLRVKMLLKKFYKAKKFGG